MDHIKVLKRAWEITWRYRVLWVFGIILALTTGGGSRGPQGQYNVNGKDFAPGGDLYMGEIPSEVMSTLIAIGIGLACVIVILIIASVVARYVAETSLIRMVDDYEETGEKRSVRQGFRLGWSRTAWRLFLINLLIGLPTAVVFILLFLMAASPLLLWITKNKVAGAIGTVAAIGLFFLFILLAIVVSVVLSLLMRFFRRVCALEELGVIESIRQGYDFVRRHLKDVGIMWLIMVGLGLAWIIVMIPVTILLLVVGAMLGGFPALLVGGLASLVFEGAVPWILAGAVGLPIFILVIAAPALFLGGLAEVFKSSVWTLTYRELRALESVEPEPGQLPEPDTPDLV
jgi:hypothetical protein